MEDSGHNPEILPPQITEKPASVTVFGVLNCMFGCAGLFFSLMMLSLVLKFHQTGGYGLLIMIINIIYFGFSIWLLILGIGLLSMRKWSRRGTVLYGWLKVLLFIVDNGVYFLALLFAWAQFPLGRITELVIRMSIDSIGGLFYPLLLLIFMQSAKVKQAFAAVGG